MTTSATNEGFFGILCGVVYGLTSPIIGQPFDTIKTKQQTQPGYMGKNVVECLRTVIKADGVKGLYRGLSGPLAGSLVYRSIQFGSYAYVYELFSSIPTLRRKVPGTHVELRVVLGGIISGFSRATVETPLEYYKVVKQTGGTPIWTSAFRGYSVTLARSCGLMTTFFILLDVFGRRMPDIASGPFFRGGICATMAWWTVWPLEVAKSQIQSGLPGPTKIIPRLGYILKTQGMRAMSRGLFIGSMRSVVANGASMCAFASCQTARKSYGL